MHCRSTNSKIPGPVDIHSRYILLHATVGYCVPRVDSSQKCPGSGVDVVDVVTAPAVVIGVEVGIGLNAQSTVGAQVTSEDKQFLLSMSNNVPSGQCPEATTVLLSHT